METREINETLGRDALGLLDQIWADEPETIRAGLRDHAESIEEVSGDWGSDEAEITDAWDYAEFLLGCMTSDLYTVAEEEETPAHSSLRQTMHTAASAWLMVYSGKLHALKAQG